MKLNKYLTLLPILLATTATGVQAAEEKVGTQFQFSAEVRRSVDKDLMRAQVYSRKTGKNLAELKQAVSTNLNKVLEQAKSNKAIQVSADGVTNYANYDQKGKVNGWVAEGRIELESKDFAAIAKILENLGDEIAIGYIDFSVSNDKMSQLEDEMTLEAIKQFQHKAEIIQKGLNAKSYQLKDIQLDTPNSEGNRIMYASARNAKVMMSASVRDEMPLEAGKAEVSARASGTVVINQ